MGDDNFVYSDITDAEERSAEEIEIERLTKELQNLKDARLQDRFFFIATVVILFDTMFFTMIDGIGAAALVAFQVILLFAVAKRMGVEEVKSLIERFVERAADQTNSK